MEMVEDKSAHYDRDKYLGIGYNPLIPIIYRRDHSILLTFYWDEDEIQSLLPSPRIDH